MFVNAFKEIESCKHFEELQKMRFSTESLWNKFLMKQEKV